MKIKLKLLGFFIISMVSFNSYSMLQKVKNVIGTALTFPIAHKKTSNKIEKIANETIKDIDPKLEITSIKQLNKLGQLLFGYQNTIAIPFLNFLIVNEKWLKTLSDQSKKFVIGRCAAHLSNQTEYVSYKYVLPFLLYNFLKLTIPKNRIKFFSKRSQNQIARIEDKILLFMIQSGLTRLITAYFSRALEYQADTEAAYKLKCPDQAIEILKDLNKFRNDKTILGSISSKLPFLKLLNLCLFPTSLYYKKNYKYYDILLTSIWTPLLLNQIETNIPGRINNVSNKLENFFSHLPIANLFSNFPKISDRIIYLRKVSKKIKKEEQFSQEKAQLDNREDSNTTILATKQDKDE